MAGTTETLATELAFRASDGVEVALLWSAADGRVKVAVSVPGTGDSFELEVAREAALDAFYHPFAYAASRGVDFHPLVAA